MKSLLVAASLSCTSCLTAQNWSVQTLPENWELRGFTESEDLSGIAAINENHCLIGTDEQFYVQPGLIRRDRHRIDAQAPIPLITNPSSKAEVDAEGVAVDPKRHRYYVTGSHGVGKKKGDFQPDRHAVFLLPVDPNHGEIITSGIRRASLLPWLEQDETLSEHVRVPLQKNGINVEGLTFHDDKLWFGLRGPNIDGKGYVLEVDPDSLFQSSKPIVKVHQITLGKDRGIREITAVRNGFIILTGNSAAEPSKKYPVTLSQTPDSRFDLWFWQPESGREPEKIGRVPESPGKAEAMLVLKETDSYIDLLLIFDSAPDGGPLSVRLTRPNRK